MQVVTPASHLWDWLIENVVTRPSSPAFWGWRQGKWQQRTWLEVASGVVAAQERLEDLGIGAGDRVATWAVNGPAWPLLDFALQGLGAVHVPISPLAAPAQVAFVVEHSQSKLLISDADLGWPRVLTTVPGPLLHAETEFGWGWDEATHADPLTVLWRRRERLPEAEEITTLLYTSGTTGEPKGVSLTQRNLVSNAIAKLQVLRLGPDDVRLGILPLSHIFGRTCDLYTGLAVGCTHVIGRGREHWFEDLQQFRPTYLNAVPYFYERCLREANWGLEAAAPERLREILGGRIRLCNCGGAPLPDAVHEAFEREGITLVTGYGLTETSPVLTSNAPGAARRGTVGRAVPGVELRISDDGEVLARGDGVMAGYYLDPQGTASVFRDGWFLTGDLGSLDADGYLTLLGRRKELLITRGGRKIVPGYLESRLSSLPWVEQVMVLGDGRNYVTALLIPRWQRFHERWPELARAMEAEPFLIEGEGQWDGTELRREIDRALDDLARWEQVGRWALVRQPFSIDEGTLTAKGSLRRHQVLRSRPQVIARLYRD